MQLVQMLATVATMASASSRQIASAGMPIHRSDRDTAADEETVFSCISFRMTDPFGGSGRRTHPEAPCQQPTPGCCRNTYRGSRAILHGNVQRCSRFFKAKKKRKMRRQQFPGITLECHRRRPVCRQICAGTLFAVPFTGSAAIGAACIGNPFGFIRLFRIMRRCPKTMTCSLPLCRPPAGC